MNLGFLNKRQRLLEVSMGYSQPIATQHFVRKPKKMAVLEHPNLKLEDLTGLSSLDLRVPDERQQNKLAIFPSRMHFPPSITTLAAGGNRNCICSAANKMTHNYCRQCLLYKYCSDKINKIITGWQSPSATAEMEVSSILVVKLQMGKEISASPQCRQ